MKSQSASAGGGREWGCVEVGVIVARGGGGEVKGGEVGVMVGVVVGRGGGAVAWLVGIKNV